MLDAFQRKNASYRRAAAEIAGKQRMVSAVPGLIRLLNDPDQWVKLCAAQSLVQFSESRVEKRLLQAFSEEDLTVIAGAYEFFIRKGVPGSEKFLIRGMTERIDGNPSKMATVFWNCGNPKLKEAARSFLLGEYARFQVEPVPKWGSEILKNKTDQ